MTLDTMPKDAGPKDAGPKDAGPKKAGPNEAGDLDPAIRELLPNYIRRRESDVETIVFLLSRGDFDEIRRLAHNMRGSGAAYGYPRITELGGLIEEAAKQQNTESLAALAEEFGGYVKHMRPT